MEENNNKINNTELLKSVKFKFSAFINFLTNKLSFLSEELRKRVITSIILIPIVLIIIFFSKTIFTLFVVSVSILMGYEWMMIVKDVMDDIFWKILGVCYIAIPMTSLIVIRNLKQGEDIILWLFLVVWSTDIGGYFVGKAIGGPKLAPQISPKKTWSGLLGGIIASMLIGFISSIFFSKGAQFFMVLSGILAIVEQIGDLTESKFKRLFDVKDSGDIIPGHGGVMDRLDGLTFTAPIVALIASIFPFIF